MFPQPRPFEPPPTRAGHQTQADHPASGRSYLAAARSLCRIFLARLTKIPRSPAQRGGAGSGVTRS